jgi:hypothetical protein
MSIFVKPLEIWRRKIFFYRTHAVRAPRISNSPNWPDIKGQKCAPFSWQIIDMTTFFVLWAECKGARWFVIRNITHFVSNFKFQRLILFSVHSSYTSTCGIGRCRLYLCSDWQLRFLQFGGTAWKQSKSLITTLNIDYFQLKTDGIQAVQRNRKEIIELIWQKSEDNLMSQEYVFDQCLHMRISVLGSGWVGWATVFNVLMPIFTKHTKSNMWGNFKSIWIFEFISFYSDLET